MELDTSLQIFFHRKCICILYFSLIQCSPKSISYVSFSEELKHNGIITLGIYQISINALKITGNYPGEGSRPATFDNICSDCGFDNYKKQDDDIDPKLSFVWIGNDENSDILYLLDLTKPSQIVIPGLM